MSFAPPDDENPFAPPRSTIGARASEVDFESDSEVELIRRHHLSHESSIRSMGLLGYLGASFSLLFAIGGVLVVSGAIEGNEPPPGTAPEMMRLAMWIGTLFWGAVALVGLAVGFGLRRLQVWSRWTAMVLSVLALLYGLLMSVVLLAVLGGSNAIPVVAAILFGAAILAYVFYLLVAPKSGVVFSAEYRQVIAKTPEIACRMSLVLKLVLGVVVAVVLLAMFGMISSLLR